MAVHVCPKTDSAPHLLEGLDCPCEPVVEWLNPETGLPWSGNGPLVIHHCHEMPNLEKIGWAVVVEG